MKVWIFLFLTFFLSLKICAQDTVYFQQRVNHCIAVTLNDSLHTLTGMTKITYFNQSPDTLTSIYMHLWANGYQNRHTSFAKQLLNNGNTAFEYAKKEDYGYIDHLDFKINQKPISFSYLKNHLDVALLNLPEVLLPGDSIVIETPFFVKIPGDFSRMGHRGQAYQITQWYPKPAVYDVRGWHLLSYLEYGEFYSDFGSFDVSITLPENYYVAATGALINNPTEEMRIATRIKETKKKNFAYNNTIPPSAKTVKTLRFYQDSIHDFAWFADKRFLILQRKVEMPHTEKEVTATAYFLPENYEMWEQAPLYISWALSFYSEKLGDYPYRQCTAVDGALNNGGGMEYPMITVINGAYNSRSNEEIIMHEVGHNWLYGILAFNERQHPWLDEGLNTFYEEEYLSRYFPNDLFLEGYRLPNKLIKNDFPNFYLNYFSYLMAQSNQEFQPCGLASAEYSESNYFLSVYRRPVMLWRYFKQAIGDSLFDKTMYDFAQKWSFKHPYPTDLQYFWEQRLGFDLDWFFGTLINTTTPIDMKIKSIKKLDADLPLIEVETKDKTHLAGFYSISFLDKKGNFLSEDWYFNTGNKNKDTLIVPEGAYKVFVNASLNIPEINKRDNQMRLHGLFKKVDFPKLYFLWHVSNPDEYHLLYAPVAGWNSYDKWMFGMALYSDPVVKPPFDFTIMPMYSFVSKTATGIADMGYTFGNLFSFAKRTRLGITAKQFGYQYIHIVQHYQKIEPSLRIDFKTAFNKNNSHQLLFRNVFIWQGVNSTNDANENSTYSYSVFNMHYAFKNKQKINPWSSDFDVQVIKNTIRLSAEVNAEYTYAKEKGFYSRFFIGKIANPATQFLPNLNFSAAGNGGSYTGSSDYLFDYSLMGRSEMDGIFGYQMVKNEGGFVTPTPLGRSNDWLVSANFILDIPGKLPLSGFFNISTFSGASKMLDNGEIFIYEAGIRIVVFQKIFEINIPLLISKDMQRVSDLNQQKFVDRIRFIFNLNNLNPLKATSNYAKTLF